MDKVIYDYYYFSSLIQLISTNNYDWFVKSAGVQLSLQFTLTWPTIGVETLHTWLKMVIRQTNFELIEAIYLFKCLGVF